ncbi:MAG: DivIVA domain-containing protein [Acidimicrobiia bacterium]|nr:DivIVA domain-containing protein [Acidimicrobiia bacterium]
MKERTPQTQRIDEKSFSVVRKGYDPREVKTYLEDLEHAFQDIEGHARRTSQRVVELERDLNAARATENASLDNAMMAVFDVKDRMLDRAERRAQEITDEAGKTATTLLAEVEAARGREPKLEADISNLEHELVLARADGERLRTQLNDAHTVIDRLESTATVDITSLQAQLTHEQEQNEQLRTAAREADFMRRDYEQKLAEAQQAAMHARAELEEMKAALNAQVGEEQDEVTGTVVYERSSAVDDYDFVVGAEEEQLRQAI